MSCHPEGGLVFAPKRKNQPQSKDPYTPIRTQPSQEVLRNAANG